MCLSFSGGVRHVGFAAWRTCPRLLFIIPSDVSVVSDPMVDDEAAAPRPKYRLRFSLLALFVFITLVCLALAWLVQPNRVVATALFEVQGSNEN